MKYQLLVLSLFCLGAAGCNIFGPDANPKAGDSCTTGSVCDTSSVALFCVDHVLRGVPCKGPNGCGYTVSAVTCDTSRNVEGDACKPDQEGKTQCSTADATKELKCQDGVYVVSQTCATKCVTNSGATSCQ